MCQQTCYLPFRDVEFGHKRSARSHYRSLGHPLLQFRLRSACLVCHLGDRKLLVQNSPVSTVHHETAAYYVLCEPHLLRQNLGSMDRRIRTESSTSDQSCMSFLRNPFDRCLGCDSAG